MVGNFKVVTLCGSTKFKDEFMEVQKQLTLSGILVLSVGAFGHSGDVFSEETKIMLDDMHKRKIDMADEIFVINKNGYIGNNTKSEIEYAIATGKKVNYLEPIQNKNCTHCNVESLYQYKISDYEEIYKCPTCNREYAFDVETKEFIELA
jgi:hypothetical protein